MEKIRCLICYLCSLECQLCFGQNPGEQGGILSSSFCGQLADCYSHVFILIHPLDEFSFKQMRMWGQSKISPCCIYVWCKSRELGGRGSPRFPTQMVEIFFADLTSYKKLLGRVAFGTIYIALAKSWRVRGAADRQLPDYQSHALGLSTQQQLCC